MHPDESTNVEENGAPQVADTKVKPALTEDQKNAVVGFIEYLIDNLTLKRVFLTGLFGIISLVMVALYENRQDVLGYLLTSKPPVKEQHISSSWSLSKGSIGLLEGLMHAGPIAFASVSAVDPAKNSRAVRHILIRPDIVVPEATANLLQAGRPQAVFDYDAKNTAQMVAILSNEFRCDNYTDTNLFKLAPELSDRLTTVCRLAIPPFIGQMVGYVTIGLDRKVSRAEIESLRLEVSRVAVEIYLTDITGQPKP